MSKNSKTMAASAGTITIRTTVGDLLAAALDATGGQPAQAAEILTQDAFEFRSNRRIRFV
jgi:hypothetical protein